MTFGQIKTILGNKTVGIAGCGGLGSNCAVALARVGVGRLIIADFDVVSESNLNRQYYFSSQVGMKKVVALTDNISKINPLVQLVAYDMMLTPADITRVFENCNLVIEAFDQAAMKSMIIEVMVEGLPHIPLIVGNGMAGFGKSNRIRVEKISDTLYICGDGTTEIGDEIPPLAPRVGIVANMQANLALQLLLGNDNPEDL